ncbi:hypothetical protein D3C81_1356270 [compost metagenome]
MLFKKLLRILTSLSKTLARERIPGTTLINNILLYSDIDQTSFLGNPFTIHNIDLSLFEWRSHFVLNYLDSCTVTYHIVTHFDSFDTTYIQSNG